MESIEVYRNLFCNVLAFKQCMKQLSPIKGIGYD